MSLNTLFSRIVVKLCKINRTYINKQQLRLFINKCNTVGKNPDIIFPCSHLGLKYVSIGDNFHCGERLKIRTFSEWNNQQFSPNINIGNNVSIESDCHISAINSVQIDDNVLIASFVYISDHLHGYITDDELSYPPIKRNLSSKGPIHICKNVWLGEKVTVLSGVTIGEGSIIGANSVVTKNIPPFSIACGAPARVIKTLK